MTRNFSLPLAGARLLSAAEMMTTLLLIANPVATKVYLRGSGQANVGDEDPGGGTGLNPLERDAAGSDFSIAGGRLKTLEWYVGKRLRSGDIDIQGGAVLGSVLNGIDETNLRWNACWNHNWR